MEEKGKKKNKKKLNIKRVIIVFIILFVIPFSIYKIYKTNIKNIFIIGNVYLSDQEIIDIAKIENYPNSLKNSSASIKNRLEKNRYIYKAKVEKGDFLKTVYIKVKENYPLFYYQVENKTVLYNGKYDDKVSSSLVVINKIPDTIYDKLQWVLRFQEREEYSTTLWYAVSLVQVAINWILWILAFVALAYMLYSWFLVLSSWADDSKAKKGRKWISTAAIALAWIWLSWLIVSAMIWFITFLSESK